jgi:hypothetical protein
MDRLISGNKWRLVFLMYSFAQVLSSDATPKSATKCHKLTKVDKRQNQNLGKSGLGREFWHFAQRFRGAARVGLQRLRQTRFGGCVA